MCHVMCLQVMCPQLSETVSGDLLGQEDCLVLNIYSPVQVTTDLLPVMVYIYGGGFVTGSNRYCALLYCTPVLY